MNGKTGFIIGIVAAALLFGMVQLASAGFTKAGDGSVTIAYKLSAADANRIHEALSTRINVYKATSCDGNPNNVAGCIGQTSINFLQSFTKDYEVAKAVENARVAEEAKPGITVDASAEAAVAG